jgi:hypothetical protein
MKTYREKHETDVKSRAKKNTKNPTQFKIID